MKYPGKVVSGTRPTANLTTASGIWLTQDEMQGMYAGAWPGATPPSLYTFTDITIAPLVSSGIYGATGPSLAQLTAASSSTGSLSWQSNTSNFNSTAGIISWTVPQTASYSFEIWGARGGNGAGGPNYLGGYGARMKGTFSLTSGDIIKILIGQMGGASYGGGGGGTFVTYANNVPLIVAGGGNTTSPWSATASHAPTTTSGVASSSGGAGGTNGSGGTGGNNMPGGAGLTGDGGASSCSSAVSPKSFINGGAGGTTCNSIGGFGGGSGSDGCCQGASGPGGGYSGGGAGNGANVYGGAGGSYNNGTSQSNDAGNTGTATRSNNGQVIITKL